MSASHEGLRREARALIRAGFVSREVVRPLAIFAANLSLYLVLQILIAVTPWPIAKTGMSILAGIVTSTLFIVAHDCAHGSFTVSPLLNRVLGTLAMLPGLHPYSLWERGHNRVHHRFTLQMDRDNAFPPLSPRQYAALPLWRRMYYRFLRTFAGQLIFYMVEIWIPTMILPVKREIRPFRKVYGADLAAVILFAMLLVGITAVTTASRLHVPVSAGQIGRAALYNLAIPVLVWMTLISFLTVVQHTHPQARWRISDGQPSSVGDQADGTIHVVFPEWLDLVFHRVMHHHAHHLQPAIPVYHLKYAQHHLSKVAEGAAIPFVVARWSLHSHFDMAARCKLFDIENDCWRDFAGSVTGRPLAVSTP